MANPGTEVRHRKVQIGLRLSVSENEKLEAAARAIDPAWSIQQYIRYKLLGPEDRRSRAHSLVDCWCGMPHRREDFL